MTDNLTTPTAPRPPALTPDGTPYLLRGAKLLLEPGYRRFILIPIASNVVLFVLTVMMLVGLVGGLMETYLNWLPEWLAVVQILLWIIFGLLISFLYSLTFTAITNLIAAPFNGLLAEKIQMAKTQKPLPTESIWSITKRTLAREIHKLLYFVGYGVCISLGVMALSVIPLLNFIAPLIGLAWACWVLAVQYVDYAADNNQVDFKSLRRWCAEKRLQSMTFGVSIFVCTMIPVVNILVMSAAVAGSTLYWLEQGGETTKAS
jgi:CysZ protein